MQLAQLNIADALYTTDDARMAGFTNRIDAINAIAEVADGFIWRLKDEAEDDALAFRIDGLSDQTLVNMSVWSNVESLFRFVYKTAHAKVMTGKDDWFRLLSNSHMVLWWIEDNHIPTLAEAKAKLDLIRLAGPSPDAFNFQIPFDENGQTITPKFPKKDCA